MSRFKDPSLPRACSDRQVLLYPADWEEPLPGSMEEIRISIVNDRVPKRERDEDTEVTPCAKRSHLAAFSCSTPKPASSRTWVTKSKLGKEHQHVPTWQPQKEEEEEWDDSLLEPSDNEDVDNSSMTLDEIETLLADDDDNADDSCYAAEPLQKYNEVTTCIVTFTPSDSETEGENGRDAPWKTLDVYDPLIEESECEGDASNYAAMPPSPCSSAIDADEVTIQNQPSVCNVKTPHESPTAKPVTDSDLPTPLSDIQVVSTSLLPNSCSANLPLQPSLSLSTVDVAVKWSEDPDLAFDCDIDNLLAISPGAASSIEDDNGVKLATLVTNGKKSVISDSKLPPGDLEPDQIATASAACSDVAQDISPLSLNTPGSLKGHQQYHHDPADPEPFKEPLPSLSSLVTAAPELSTRSFISDQNVESQKSEETKWMPNVESTSRSTEPTTSAAPRASGSEPKTSCKGQEKPRIAVAGSPRSSFREVLSEYELKKNKESFIKKVWMHIESQGQCNLDDPLRELASLQNQISQEDRNWQHPSDFTRRNYPRLGTKPSKRCSLNQWVTKNGGSTERFKDIPSPFERSPIPGVLPFSCS